MTLDAFLAALDSLPIGSFEAHYQGRRYTVSRMQFSNGKADKLVAHEAGGRDYISLNLYRLKAGALLKPCEMPQAKVMHFVLHLMVKPKDT